MEPLLPEDGPFLLGEKFGLTEILCAPFVIRLYLTAKIGLLGEGIEGKFEEAKKWDKWAKAVLANENVRKTFNYELEARRAVNRVRKVRDTNELTAANVRNSTKV